MRVSMFLRNNFLPSADISKKSDILANKFNGKNTLFINSINTYEKTECNLIIFSFTAHH